MLVCLACPKQANLPTTPHPDDSPHQAALGKPAGATLAPSREHIKSFTTQLKDIVVKFSTGAYRHCKPCAAAGVHGGGTDDDNQTLYTEDDDKSSILLGSNSEEQPSSDHGPHPNSIHDQDADHTVRRDAESSSSPASLSHYDLLPIGRNKRRHCRKKNSSSSKSPLSLKQLPSHPTSSDAIEELLNAHFRREERILSEEQSHMSGDRSHRDSKADRQLLEEAQLVISNRREQDHFEEHIDEDDHDDGDVHVKRSKRHVKGESPGNFEEWVAQVEPGVMITFVALPDGSNHLKRIRFSRELFSKWQAQLWWAENNEMVRELYSVSKTNAPFKPRSSARSSSSTTTSSHPQSTLQNTPELQSRVGSCQDSPSDTPLISNILEKRRSSPTPSPSGSCKVQAQPTRLDASRHLSHEFLDRHDNPLFANPEVEGCHKEGLKDSLVLPRSLWESVIEEHSRQSQQREDGDALPSADNATTATHALAHDLKRVRFIRQYCPS